MKKLKADYIIESGVYKGQGTWFFENAARDAQIHSIDTNLSFREYISDKAIYYNKDLSGINLKNMQKNKTVCFFDDHQDALNRVKFAEKNGFKVLIFEDNYPTGKGDCYSLKQAFDRDGGDAVYLRNVLKVYHELPPVFKTKKTRWGDAWDEKIYPTPKPLYESVEHEYLRIFFDEATSYTWMCYVELK